MNEKSNLKTRLEECLARPEVRAVVHEYYESRGKGNYPAIAINRWKKGVLLPPVDLLVSMAKATRTNVAYILGLTDISCPIEDGAPGKERSLEDLLLAAKMSEKDLVRALNNNYKKLELYREHIPYERIKSVISLSEATGLSMDYILGYSDYTSWEVYAKMEHPFRHIEAGAGAYVIADKSIRMKADVEDAIKRGDGSYCLLSLDGKHVIFPNGNKVSIDDEIFGGIYVAAVKPEVE